MSFEFLVSTMHKNTNEVLEMLNKSNVKCNALVVVQGDTDGYEELTQNDQSIRVFFTKERGLSKSRNMALRHCLSKYAYIMDDDVVVNNNAISELIDKMEADSVDLATCKYKCQSGNYPKKYANKEFFHTVFSAAKVASIEMCVKVEAIKEASIKFDERFGLGTSLPSGEEYIFVTDCIKAGLLVKYYPLETGIHPDLTSGLDFYTSRSKVLAKREMLKRVFGKKSFFYILLFWLKKLNITLKAGYAKSFTQVFLFGK